MKKNSLFKVLGVCFLIIVVLTWIIPAGSYQSGEFTKGTTSPVGILDFFRIPITTLSGYIGPVILILLIGALYSVMNRAGAYSKLVDHFTKKYKRRENVFALISILFFSVLAAVAGINQVLIIFVPLFVAILLRLGYRKLPTLAATIGAILAGNAASIYGFDVSGYLNYYFKLDINDHIVFKVAFFLALVVMLYLFVTKTKGKKEENLDIPLLDDDNYAKQTHKSFGPLLVVLVFVLIFLGIACYNWSYGLNYKGFEELYEKLIDMKVNGYPLIKNLIGNFNPFGYWGTTEISIVVMIASALIGWLYSLKMKDYFEAFKKGALEVLPVAFYVGLASIVTSVVLGSSTGGSIYYTIAHWILGYAGKVMIAVVMVPLSIVSGLLINEFPYYANYMIANITSVYTATTAYPLIAFVMQSAHGLVMFLVPTSVLLVMGLTYLKVSWKEWVKYIWKYVMQATIAALIIYAVLSIQL